MAQGSSRHQQATQRRIISSVEQATMTLTELCAKYKVDLYQAPDMPGFELVNPSTELAEQDAIGAPGTRVWAGRIDIEPNPRYQPYYVRGQWGNPGIFEEFWRSEPLIYDAVQGHTETQVSGLWEVQSPSVVPPGLEDAMAAFVDYHHGRLMGIASTWTRFVEHACSMLIFGFAPFEVLWGTDEVTGQPYIHDLQYRECSTVERWYFDARMTRLMGADFRPGGTSALSSYQLWCDREQPLLEQRLMVCNLAARGLNVEGVSPIRPALHYIQFKQLIQRIAAVTAEKYGVPITYIYEDPSAFSAMMQSADDEEMADVYNVVASLNAVEGATLTLPGALRIGQISPTGGMPSFKDLIDYCDQMILSPFSNEGSLLGLRGSVGSYALGEVKERDTLRSAPYYARRIAAPINDLLRRLARAAFGDLPEYPTLCWRIDGMEDGSAWIKDALALFGGPVQTWPEPAQETALAKLGLPPDTLSKARQQEQQIAPAPGAAPTTQMAEELEGEPASATLTAELMDDAEAQLAMSFRRIQRDQQARWRELVRDNTTSEDVIADREQIRSEYLPRYQEAVREVLEDTMQAGALGVAELVGVGLRFDLGLTDSIMLLIASVAEEAFNRSLGVMTDAEQRRRDGDRRTAVPTLAPSTLATVSSRIVSTAYNAGREQAVEQITASTSLDGKAIWAEYSSVLDGKTCAVCKDLDGTRVQVGSQKYKDISPPHKCLGGHRCRCIWIYEIAGQRIGVV